MTEIIKSQKENLKSLINNNEFKKDIFYIQARDTLETISDDFAQHGLFGEKVYDVLKKFINDRENDLYGNSEAFNELLRNALVFTELGSDEFTKEELEEFTEEDFFDEIDEWYEMAKTSVGLLDSKLVITDELLEFTGEPKDILPIDNLQIRSLEELIRDGLDESNIYTMYARQKIYAMAEAVETAKNNEWDLSNGMFLENRLSVDNDGEKQSNLNVIVCHNKSEVTLSEESKIPGQITIANHRPTLSHLHANNPKDLDPDGVAYKHSFREIDDSHNETVLFVHFDDLEQAQKMLLDAVKKMEERDLGGHYWLPKGNEGEPSFYSPNDLPDLNSKVTSPNLTVH